MDYSLQGSSVHGILQARILEWVAIPFSRGSSWPRNWTQVSCVAGRFFTDWATLEGSKSQGSQWHLLPQVLLQMTVFFIALLWILETILLQHFCFRDGEAKVQREEELPKVTLKNQNPDLLSSPLVFFQPHYLKSQGLLTLCICQGASFGLQNIHQVGPSCLGLLFAGCLLYFRCTW